MALKGQGDPRWIVENREDGTNVNNWHWTERDFTGWARDKLVELLDKYVFESDVITATVNDVNTKGEVTVNTRKQKVIFLYELDVTLKWEGEIKGNAGTTYKGTIQMPYISEENDDDDFEVRVTIEGSGGKHDDVRSELRKISIPILKQKIPAMLQELRELTIEKTKLQPKVQPSAKLDRIVEETSPSPPPKKETQVKSSTGFTSTEKFRCSPRELFECLVDPARVRAYAGGDAIVSREKGGKFKLFGGSVEGENVQVEAPRKLVQKWRFSSWPSGHYSTVTITLEEKDSRTILKLQQEGIPSDDKERTEQGWDYNFWTRIKGIFGFGSML